MVLLHIIMSDRAFAWKRYGKVATKDDYGCWCGWGVCVTSTSLSIVCANEGGRA